MIRSMTGYGGAKGVVEGLNVTVELKSVNNRYLDIAVRMPRNFLFAEDAVKSTIQQHVSRGKLDVFVTIDSSQAADTVLRVNEPLLRAYIDTLNTLAVRYDLKNDMSLMSLMRFPDILSVEKAEADQDKIRAGLVALTQQALADYDQMREREGAKLRADVEEKLARIESLVTNVEAAAPETAAAYEARLRQKLEAVLAAADIDESRIIAEAAIYADHVAVDEETVRLRSHIAQLRQMLESGSPVGRKADFLIQEFNREANTIGSKCQNADIAKMVVDLKSEIEKIREQIQNIESGAVDLKLINIGYGNYVSAERLLAVVSPDSAPIKRIVQDSREIGMLIDATYGRKTQAVLIMDTGHAVLSALPPDAVQGRVQALDQETGGDAT